VDLGLEGRRALVTAASRGLGRACAEALTREGARVFISSRGREQVENAAREIGAAGYREADVSDAQQVQQLVDSAVNGLGGLDILVVNAGGPPAGGFQATDEAAWEGAWRLTLMSAVRLTRAALPHLKKSDQGRIVNITSASVKEPIPNLVLSNAYRAAVTGTARTLATELAADRITVNNIAPESILTQRIRELRNVSTAEEIEAAAQQLPMKRFGDPAELGALCAFLCSRQAAYITGQTIVIDGGAAKSVF
jgi:3-oxoacyl-[acyl-carrier protein] reductase